MKWRIFSSISCLSLALASLWACHSSSSSNDDTSSGLSGACQHVADATSAFAQKCGEPLTAFGASDRDKHDIERSAALCVATYSLPGIADPSSRLNACAQALATADCNTLGEIAECNVVPAGTLSNGTTCAVNEQCSGGICIFSVSDAGSAPDASTVVCGTCATAIAPGQPCDDPTLCASGNCSGSPRPLCQAAFAITTAIGEPCGGGPIGCAPPGYCAYDSNGNSGTCAASGKLGESCDTGSTPRPCEPNLTCANSVCTAPIALGGDCTSGTCGPGLFCGGGEKCLAITYGPPTASCDGVDLKCIQGNCPNTSPFGPPTAVCPKIIADGQPCNSAVGSPSCDTFATCFNGICSLVASSPSCQ